MLEEKFQKDAEFTKFETGKINISSYNIYLDNNDFISARCNSYEDGEILCGFIGKVKNIVLQFMNTIIN